MAYIQAEFFSQTLNQMTGVNVLLPLPRDAAVAARDIPVLYLLHGMGDDHNMWIRKTTAETAALRAGITLVMPYGAMSCYENMACGRKYRDFMLEELPDFIKSTFPVSIKREKTFIAGCSMGGCGALKLALARPDLFAAVGCFSAGYLEYRPDNRINTDMLKRVYGTNIAAADERIEAEIEQLSTNGPRLRILHYWGDCDILRESALEMRDRITECASEFIDYTGTELPGVHDWDLWNQCIRDFIPRLGTERTKYRMF